MPAPETRDWAAWIDRMPGGDGPTLHVTATVACPTAGYAADLVPAQAPDAAPGEARFRLVLRAPDGIVAQVLTDVAVEWAGPAEDGVTAVSIETVVETIPVTDVV